MNIVVSRNAACWEEKSNEKTLMDRGNSSLTSGLGHMFKCQVPRHSLRANFKNVKVRIFKDVGLSCASLFLAGSSWHLPFPLRQYIIWQLNLPCAIRKSEHTMNYRYPWPALKLTPRHLYFKFQIVPDSSSSLHCTCRPISDIVLTKTRLVIPPNSQLSVPKGSNLHVS